MNFNIIKKYNFLDYLRGGIEISMMVSIDFTGSNGNPKNPKSLHYNAPGYVNEYESAIRSIGDILMYYDSDKKFPTFGFGKKN
jgi:hypothetical protein